VSLKFLAASIIDAGNVPQEPSRAGVVVPQAD
jgi:hypothetical protein